jgi:mitogen-activated protein kinase 15
MLLASQKYGKAVDVWGIGLVLGELILGSPVFPGLSVMNQIERIIELTQMPTSADIKVIQK